MGILELFQGGIVAGFGSHLIVRHSEVSENLEGRRGAFHNGVFDRAAAADGEMEGGLVGGKDPFARQTLGMVVIAFQGAIVEAPGAVDLVFLNIVLHAVTGFGEEIGDQNPVAAQDPGNGDLPHQDTAGRPNQGLPILLGRRGPLVLLPTCKEEKAKCEAGQQLVGSENGEIFLRDQRVRQKIQITSDRPRLS